VRLLGTIACGLSLLLAPACAAQPAPEAVEVARAAIPWPGRAATVVRDLEVGPWTLRWVGPFGLGDLEADAADAALVAGTLGVGPERVEFERYGSIVVRMPEGELSKTARIAGKPAAAFEVLTAEARGEGEDAGYQLQRTWFALYEPRGEAVGATVVLLPGMFGTPEPVVDALVGKLRGRGWHVLRVLTHSSRFTEKRSYELDPGAPAALAGEIAAEFGGRTAENALAVEAVCAHIAGAMPETPIGARIGLGMSGGGMALPTVMAREHDAYRGAVYIGAGCDFAAIAMESNYADWIDAVRVSWAGEPGEAAREAFAEAYRGAAPLDGYHTALAVADIPTLMVHGEHDQAVPARLGDLLWERLGRPERWSVQATHETLFLAYLPGKFDDLLDWMRARVGG
jgi:fermentation-respiration switch protein FrsA (DUF1100 family)